jgi:hypothetical protein
MLCCVLFSLGLCHLSDPLMTRVILLKSSKQIRELEKAMSTIKTLRKENSIKSQVEMILKLALLI